MNKINKIFPILSFVLLLTMTGCLNDSEYMNNQIGTRKTADQNFVEIHLTTSNTTNFIARAYNVMNRDTTITQFVPVQLLNGPAASDVTVTFTKLTTSNSPLLDSLVNFVDTISGNLLPGYVIPDSTIFTIVNPGRKVIIPKGSTLGYIQVKINPTNFLGATWVVGFKLTGVSDSKYTIGSNVNTGFVKFGIKNQYDGLYEDKGYFIHPALGTSTFDYKGAGAVEFATTGSNSLEKSNAGDRAIATDVTITNQTMTVNGATVYKVTIAIPDYPGTNSGQTDTDDSGNPMNYYNPATKTFELWYWYNSGAHRKIRETLIYQGPR